MIPFLIKANQFLNLVDISNASQDFAYFVANSLCDALISF
jgi:hypothetical protein